MDHTTGNPPAGPHPEPTDLLAQLAAAPPEETPPLAALLAEILGSLIDEEPA